MRSWQIDSLAQLRRGLPDAEVTPYGSVLEPDSLDSWSDLDVAVRTTSVVDLESVLGARIWASQTARDAEWQVIRLVLEDGRRVDLTITGAEADVPAPAADNEVRFDAALAAARFGRGSDLIGLHLVLGILRESLVHRMVAADRREGRTHHRHATAQDAHTADVAALLRAPLGPATARGAYELYCACRAEVDPDFVAATEGLDAVITRGTEEIGEGLVTPRDIELA
ncbi:hypothetical protein [Brachybacterium sp. AOP3-A1-3]|uniref:hypothetical protein n=1 Tax=Brachybacterium sp. AOP3-A1-3 TaxID=3457699 RepID=UPI0040335A8A